MKTLELEELSIARYFEYLKDFYKNKWLKSDEFHFLFEPELIIRYNPDKDIIFEIKKYLNGLKVSFIEYDFPSQVGDRLHKNAKLFENEVCDEFTINSLNLNSRAVLEMTGWQYERFIERTWHCMNNMAGKSWKEEAIYGLNLSRRRFKFEKEKMYKIICRLFL